MQVNKSIFYLQMVNVIMQREVPAEKGGEAQHNGLRASHFAIKQPKSAKVKHETPRGHPFLTAADTIPDHRRVIADAGEFLPGTGVAVGGDAFSAAGVRASPRRTPAYRGSRRRGATGGCGCCCSGGGCGDRERERGVGGGRRSVRE